MLKLISQRDGYSIYENPSEEIKQEIQKITDPNELISYWDFNFPNDKWMFDKILSNGSVQLKSDQGNISSISKDNYEKELKDAKLEKINREFSVGKVLNEYLFPLKIGTSIYHKMHEAPLTYDSQRNESFYTGVNSVFVREYWNAWDLVSSVAFENSYTNGNGHIFFNENGDIENRDYNQDLNTDIPFVSKEETIENFIGYIEKRIKNEDLLTSGGFYFTESFYLNINMDERMRELKVEFWPRQSGMNYFFQGESYRKKKRPKKTLPADKKEFLEMLKNKCLEIKLNKFW